MYTEKTYADELIGLVDGIFNEAVQLVKNLDGNNGCVAVSVNPIDGKSQLAKLVESEPTCTCSCKSNGLKFKNIIDDIDSVIFNDPATIVTFKDGSKVCVKACEKDTFTKEAGLMYAIVKRLYANDIDENGYLKSTGLGSDINKVIENAFDQKKAEADKRAKLRAKTKAKEAKAKENLANEVSEKAAQEAVEEIYDKK